jgi:tetratricopeptide (TPR) repeat protein
MFEYNFFEDDFDDSLQEPYPDFYYDWDESLTKNTTPRFLEDEELVEIIEIYLNENEIDKAKETIQYALKLHSKNEDLVYDILLLLNDFELWNDLLALSEQYKHLSEVWVDGHKLSALLHLGMEEDAFLFFRKMKTKYEKDKEDLSIIYQVMGEALNEVDLFEASADVISEAIAIMGIETEFLWMLLYSYAALEIKEKALNVAAQIETMSPMDADTWHRLGIVYNEIEESEKAIEAFEFAESLGYKSPTNYLNLISLYEKNSNGMKALEKAKEYLYAYPQSYMIHIVAANLCSQMEMWEEALFHVNAALESIPEMESLYLYKSNFLLHLGEQKKAILALKDGIKLTNDTQGEIKKELNRLQDLYPNWIK